MIQLFIIAALNANTPAWAGDLPAATGQPAGSPVSPPMGGEVVPGSSPMTTSQGFKRAAQLHALSTHDVTYWGLPLGQALASLLIGVLLHKRAVEAQANIYPNSSMGVLTLWGASLLTHLICAIPVIGLFAYWFAATNTTTHAEFMKRAVTASGAEVLALLIPPIIWIILTLIPSPRYEAR